MAIKQLSNQLSKILDTIHCIFKQSFLGRPNSRARCLNTFLCQIYLCFSSLLRRFFPNAFRERGREREKHPCERKTLISYLALCTPTRDWTCNLGMCPHPRAKTVASGRMLQPTEPYQPGFWCQVYFDIGWVSYWYGAGSPKGIFFLGSPTFTTYF